MRIFFFLKTCLLAGSVFLSSCAYMQTHKNIEESFKEHTGYKLDTNPAIYKAGNDYYIAVQKQQIKIHYPAIYDSIFLNHNNNPELKPFNDDKTTVYRQISEGTAQVLQRSDGYADLTVLSDELQNNPHPWVHTLPSAARSLPIKARIDGKPVIWTENGSTTEAPLGVRILSTADQVLIDWPGTVLYNVAIPIMAPFVFFHEFLNEQ